MTAGTVTMRDPQFFESNQIRRICQSFGFELRNENYHDDMSYIEAAMSVPPAGFLRRLTGRADKITVVTFSKAGTKTWCVDVFGTVYMSLARQIAEACAAQHGMNMTVQLRSEKTQPDFSA